MDKQINMHKRMAMVGPGGSVASQGNHLKAGGKPVKGKTEHHVHVMHEAGKEANHKIHVHHHYCGGGKVKK